VSIYLAMTSVAIQKNKQVNACQVPCNQTSLNFLPLCTPNNILITGLDQINFDIINPTNINITLDAIIIILEKNHKSKYLQNASIYKRLNPLMNP